MKYENLMQVEQQLVEDMWTLVEGSDREGVSWETLKIAMLNMIGVRTPEHEKRPEGHEHHNTTTLETSTLSPEKAVDETQPIVDGDEAPDSAQKNKHLEQTHEKVHTPIDVSKLA